MPIKLAAPAKETPNLTTTKTLGSCTTSSPIAALEIHRNQRYGRIAGESFAVHGVSGYQGEWQLRLLVFIIPIIIIMSAQQAAPAVPPAQAQAAANPDLKKESRFDPNFTQHVIDTIGAKTDDRTRELMSSLIRHLHDFLRETELTIDEWMTAVHFVNSIGQMTTPTRNEGQRICDVLGIESLVDEIAHKHASEAGNPTSSSILGPFWSPRAPFRELGGSVIQDPTPNGQVTLMHGQVLDLETKKPIVNAVFDFWQASANGKYDFQDPENQSDNNLRGKFRTNDEGKYWFYCLKPTAYSLPTDGPAGVLLKLLDRHPMRPAHIHLMISHEDYIPVTTQIFPADDPYLTTDTVFAVKDDLVVEFKLLEGDSKATLDLKYDVILAPKGDHQVKNLPSAVAGLVSNSK